MRIKIFFVAVDDLARITDMPSVAQNTYERNRKAWAYQTFWVERTGTSRGPRTSSSSPGWPGYSLHPRIEKYGYSL